MMKKGLEAALRVGVLALVLALPTLDRPAPGQAEGAAAERIAKGRLSYRIHCASCHGETGRGDGPMDEFLKLRPTDLTRLTVAHQGRFPREEVYDSIDGRREVRGHGPASMPVWGATFQDRGRDTPQEQEVREKILDLVAYVESIQVQGQGR
jgi:mono/diheme cytochrome c family protein